MFGFLFIYWIWKAFSNLAIEYDKNKWKYFFIGIGSYYGGVILGGIIVGLTFGLMNGFESIANGNFDDAGWSILYVIFGGLTCYAVYKFFENKLQKERELNKKEGIESIGVVEEN